MDGICYSLRETVAHMLRTLCAPLLLFGAPLFLRCARSSLNPVRLVVTNMRTHALKPASLLAAHLRTFCLCWQLH